MEPIDDSASSPQPEVFSEADRAHAALVVSILGPIVDGLAAALQPRTEVVLHDLTKMPGTIAAIGGNLTGRTIGGPATDLGLRTFSSGWTEHLVGYRTELSDGRPMRSSSLFLRSESGRAVACLCLNTDIGDVLQAQETLKAIGAITTIDPALAGPTFTQERFPRSVDELGQGILAEAIAVAGRPVREMKKSHKIEVVRRLLDQGFFAMRESVPMAANSLGVGRHTIYNYLNEIER